MKAGGLFSEKNQNIRIKLKSTLTPNRLKVYGGGPSERVSSKAPPLLWNYLNGTMWKWEEHLKYVLLIMKKKILNIDMYLKKKYYQDQHQYYIYRRLKSEMFSEESNHRSEKN